MLGNGWKLTVRVGCPGRRSPRLRTADHWWMVAACALPICASIAALKHAANKFLFRQVSCRIDLKIAIIWYLKPKINLFIKKMTSPCPYLPSTVTVSWSTHTVQCWPFFIAFFINKIQVIYFVKLFDLKYVILQNRGWLQSKLFQVSMTYPPTSTAIMRGCVRE